MKRPWTDAESKTLKEQYLEFRNRGELAALAKAMGRHKTVICAKARTLGLTDYAHSKPWMRTPTEEMARFANAHDSKTDAALAKEFGLTASGVEKRRGALGLAKNAKLKWDRTPHPRGALGHKHTDIVRARISATSAAAWANPQHIFNSHDYRQNLSDQMVKRHSAGVAREGYSRGRMGKRSDLENRYFRSAWEANYARYLNFLKTHGEIERWAFEPDTFWFHEIQRGVRSYLPDFKVFEKGRHYYVEVKGWMDPKSKTKLSRMAKYYPEEEVRLVGEKEYRQLDKTVSRLIEGWESYRVRRGIIRIEPA